MKHAKLEAMKPAWRTGIGSFTTSKVVIMVDLGEERGLVIEGGHLGTGNDTEEELINGATHLLIKMGELKFVRCFFQDFGSMM